MISEWNIVPALARKDLSTQLKNLMPPLSYATSTSGFCELDGLTSPKVYLPKNQRKLPRVPQSP